MANMLRKHSGGWTWGDCCSHCARRHSKTSKPQRRSRRVARAKEKVAWMKRELV